MIYLTGVSNPTIEAYAATEPALGLMAQPRSAVFNRIQHYRAGYAYDNGAFGDFTSGREFSVDAWKRGLERTVAHRALFCVVPDVVGDHEGTVRLWAEHNQAVRDVGQAPAFVLQNGCEDFSQVPDGVRAVFIGGDDIYKLSAATARVCWQAKELGVWVHMGRVNSRTRFLRAWAMGCDSVDGTFLRFGPTPLMLDRLSSWFKAGRGTGSQLDVLDFAGGAA